ncbi:hypothetical protein CSAL01_00863 [Colletotrichum salicis]|uniref:Uncharacterized protein n=1 Tax=Colletotrichum salicis TaxID=1209931 RepID=A0A135RXJ8_9PEZI|nr:hypothetical protein CSAL01_00863 [Colletotrichum salicis]
MSPSSNLVIPGIAGLTAVALIASYFHELLKRGSTDFNIDPAFDLPRSPTDLPYNKTSNIICMVFMTATGLSAVLLGARDALRSRTLLPLILPLSGAMIAFPETFIDVLGCIYYPWTDNNASFHVLGREMPPRIPIWSGYGSLMQINLQLLINKTSTRTLCRWLSSTDSPGGGWLPTPSAFFSPPHSPTATDLVGWKVLAVLFLTPMFVGGVYGFICFPVWVAINGDYGWLVTQLLGLLTMALGFITFAIISWEMVLGKNPFDLDSKEGPSRLLGTLDESSDDSFHDDEC